MYNIDEQRDVLIMKSVRISTPENDKGEKYE